MFWQCRRCAVLGADKSRDFVGALIDLRQRPTFKQTQHERRGESVARADRVPDFRGDAGMFRPRTIREEQTSGATAREGDRAQLETASEFRELCGGLARKAEHLGEHRQLDVVELENIGESERSLDDFPRIEGLPQIDVEDAERFLGRGRDEMTNRFP